MILEAVEPVEVAPDARCKIQGRFFVIQPIGGFNKFTDISGPGKGADRTAAQAPPVGFVVLDEGCENPGSAVQFRPDRLGIEHGLITLNHVL